MATNELSDCRENIDRAKHQARAVADCLQRCIDGTTSGNLEYAIEQMKRAIRHAHDGWFELDLAQLIIAHHIHLRKRKEGNDNAAT